MCVYVCVCAGGALVKSDWGVNTLCKANMGSENDMFNIHGQDLGLPWDPGGLIKLHSARLHTRII